MSFVFTEKQEVPVIGITGAKVYECVWSPPTETTPKALIVFQHGLHEHVGRYARHAEKWAEAGYVFATHDHAGHGKTRVEGSTPCFIPDWENMLQDAESHVARCMKAFPGLPVIAMGHSLGGLVTAQIVLRNQELFSAVALLAPLIDFDPSISSLTITGARILSRVLPKAGVQPIEHEKLSRDKDELKRILDDPLHYNGKVKARTAAGMLGGTGWAKKNAEKLTLPLFIIHGDADTITYPPGSKGWSERVSSKDVTYVSMPGGYHELLYDGPEASKEAFDHITKWLNAHC